MSSLATVISNGNDGWAHLHQKIVPTFRESTGGASFRKVSKNRVHFMVVDRRSEFPKGRQKVGPTF